MVKTVQEKLHGRRLYTNSCLTTGVIGGPMNNMVKEFLISNTKIGSQSMLKMVAMFIFTDLISWKYTFLLVI